MLKTKLIILSFTLLPILAEATQLSEVFERSFESSKEYTNPVMEVEVDVIFSDGKKRWEISAFWDGGKTWKVRFAAATIGDFSYYAFATDKSNKVLNTGEKSLKITEYMGENQLYQRGKIRVTNNHQHFEFSDGPPFFWLGDTWKSPNVPSPQDWVLVIRRNNKSK